LKKRGVWSTRGERKKKKKKNGGWGGFLRSSNKGANTKHSWESKGKESGVAKSNGKKLRTQKGQKSYLVEGLSKKS